MLAADGPYGQDGMRHPVRVESDPGAAYAGWRPASLPDPWVIVPSALRGALEAELKAEIAEGHEPSRLHVTAIARCGACDDVVFCVETSPIWFALVHLTWRQRREQPPWPVTTRLSLPLSASLQAHRHGHEPPCARERSLRSAAEAGADRVSLPRRGLTRCQVHRSVRSDGRIRGRRRWRS